MHIRVLWLLVVLLVIATAVRLYQIQAQSIWFDEGWSAYAAIQPTLPAVIEADPTNPPLYYILLNLSARVIGDSPFALRWFSTVFGLVVIPLSYQLARRLLNEQTGLYAAFLTAFSPLLWWASQEARMYTLMAVLLLAAALGWHQLLRSPTRWAWLAVWGGELALLYTHNTGPVVAVWLNVITVLAWIIRRSLRLPEGRVWIAGQIGVALLWSPWFVTRFLLLQEANSAVSSPPQIGFALLSRMWQSLWTGPWLMVGREPVVVTLSGILLVLALVLIPWRQAAVHWLAVHIAILSAGLLAGLWVIGNEMHGRYLVMVVPLLLVIIAAGLSRLHHAYTYIPAAGLFLATFFASVHLATQNAAYAHDDARSMVWYYAAHLSAGDTVLAWSYADRYDLAYYWERLGVQARRVILPEGADLDAVLPLLPASGDVALNVWYTQRADYRGMMECVLSHGTTNPPEVFTVYGMSNQLYRSPSLNLPKLHPLEAVFANDGLPVVALQAVGNFPPFTTDRAVCLPVQIVLMQDVDADLKAAVIVLNELGWEIARADAIFATPNQQTSSQLAPGSVLTAYPLLRLPYGAPAGVYDWRLRIYDEVYEPSGYDVLSSDAIPAGKDLLLGTWTALPGADWTRVNRSVDLPVVVNQPVSDDLVLVAHNASGSRLVNGSILRLAFLWQGSASLPEMALVAEDGSWRVEIPARRIQDRDTITLDWREVQVPPEAETGAAALRLPDETALATYTVEGLPALYTEPEFGVMVGVDIPGVGTLVGYTLESDSFERSRPIPVTLVWRAEKATSASYTVFVQLVNAEGRLIAQSDSIPAHGDRPTTGWRPGEYIVDQHEVMFHDNAAPGVATLIAGMYDAATGERIALLSGAGAITLAEGLVVR